MSLNKSKIDYLAMSEELIGRPGYTLNIVTGCKHWENGVCHVPDCWAKRTAETRLKDIYPFGFEPTFHPERTVKIGGAPKLIALNFMGDVGGDWSWEIRPNPGFASGPHVSDRYIANKMLRFALLNPQHVLLLLTKRPEWYGLVEWPDNVWCGFTATNRDEMEKRYDAILTMNNFYTGNIWVSCEPWLDINSPEIHGRYHDWLVIGGLSGRNARPVSEATRDWIYDRTIQAKRFVKRNALSPDDFVLACPREYPDTWRCER